jgi:hypothetical protein
MTSTKAHARNSERGSAGVKFLLVFVAIILIANAGYNYVPVAYAGESFKQEMQTSVVNGMAVPGKIGPVDYVKNRIRKAAADNDLPSDAFVEVKQVGNTVQAHAVYTQQVHILPFGLYTYHYQFDYTAVPNGYLLKE